MLDFIIVICYTLQYSWASLVAQLVKNLPAMWETWVRSLGWRDPLEKGKATPSSVCSPFSELALKNGLNFKKVYSAKVNG